MQTVADNLNPGGFPYLRCFDLDSESDMVRQTIDPPSVAPEPPPTMTYEEYLAWAGEDLWSEWVDGKVIVFMSPLIGHQYVVQFLNMLVGLYVNLLGLGRVFPHQTELLILDGRVSREPDLIFVATANLHRVTDRRVDGLADLVVEVISDDSVARDRRDKWQQYAAAGIPEYWLVDWRPGTQRADFFQLGPDGVYERQDPDAAGRYHSSVLTGFWLDPNWLWQNPLPDPLALLEAIAPHAIRITRPASAPDEGDARAT